MDVFEAIHTRQSISKFRPDPVPRELIERLLDAAVQAPNHHHNRPWRFVVLSGAARERLGEVMADALLIRHPDAFAEQLDVERRKPLRAPLLIAVGVDLPGETKTVDIENVCAAAAAVQNLLLAAHALGLAAIWRTSQAAYDPLVKAFLGFAPEQHLIAMVYVGYPLEAPHPPARPSFEDRTVWMDGEDQVQ
jgi:nitroreductase